MTQSRGTIPLCPHKGCAFKCCDFQQTGHILLYPGEVEEALAQGRSIAHLEMIDSNHHGGARAKCRAKDTARCDNGYKPLDCASYPFFPMLSAVSNQADRDPWVMVAKDAGCPIRGHEIPYHERYVRDVWRKLIERKPGVVTWLRSVWFDKIDPLDPESFDPLDPETFDSFVIPAE